MAKSQNDRAVIDLVINGQQAKTSLKEISLAITSTRSALNKMKEADDPAAYKAKIAEYQKLLATHKKIQAEMNQTNSAWKNFQSNAASVMTGIVGGNLVEVGFRAVVGSVTKAIASYREFNAASQELSAVTGATGQELEYLNKMALQLGPQMGKTGGQMLEAFKLAASAKPELLSNKEALVETTKAALTLAQAGKIDLAEATSVTAESLNQFGEKADQANRYINVIAAGTKEGSAEINEMGIALKNSGTVAAAQGVSFEQTNALLQSMSTIALKGGEAGTQLRNVLITLGSGANETNPKVVGLETALDNLGKKNLSTAELAKIFGKENLTAAQHIIAHRTEIVELTERLTGTNEAFAQAAKNNASFDHQMEVFQARIEGITVRIGTYLMPAITDITSKTASWAKTLEDALTPAADLANQAFAEQKTKVEDLTKNVNPLLDRYDDLKKKSVLTKDEQKELQKTIDKIAQAIPSAVTQFDAYGKAMDINTGKAREAIEVQQSLLQHFNKTAIAETTADRDKAIEDLKRAADKRKAGMTADEDLGAAGGGFRKMTDAELTAVDQEIVDLEDKIRERNNLLKGLTGYDQDARRRARRGEKPLPKTEPKDYDDKKNNKNGGGGGGLTDEEKKKRDAKIQANQEAKIAIEKLSAEAATSEKERELAQAKASADQERERMRVSKANADLKATWSKTIEDKLVADKIQINEKYAEKERELLEKSQKERGCCTTLLVPKT